MKRFVLWAASLTLLMALSVTTATLATASAHHASSIELIGQAELADVTAGICRTCKDEEEEKHYPTVIGTEWEMIGERTSSPVFQNRRVHDYIPNYTSQPRTVQYHYNDGCRNVLVSAGVNIGRQLGLTVGTVYHCDDTKTDSITVAPYRTVTLYLVDRVTYTTYTSREVWVYDDGSRESTTRTESARVENRLSFIEPVESR